MSSSEVKGQAPGVKKTVRCKACAAERETIAETHFRCLKCGLFQRVVFTVHVRREPNRDTFELGKLDGYCADCGLMRMKVPGAQSVEHKHCQKCGCTKFSNEKPEPAGAIVAVDLTGRHPHLIGRLW